MKTLKWFFTTNKDGENPAVMIISILIGAIIWVGVLWLLGWLPK